VIIRRKSKQMMMVDMLCSGQLRRITRRRCIPVRTSNARTRHDAPGWGLNVLKDKQGGQKWRARQHAYDWQRKDSGFLRVMTLSLAGSGSKVPESYRLFRERSNTQKKGNS
jgi:hypothetical protein